MLPIDRIAGAVPADLRSQPVWLHWCSQPNGTGKPKKVPYYASGKPRAGKLDTPADRRHLVTFDAAAERFDPEQHAGLGVALGAVPDTDLHLSGIDLDGCRRDAQVSPRALEIVAAAHGAYTEVSPSGTGLKIFGTGDIGTLATPGVEMYSGGRFFAVTGEHYLGHCLADLRDASEAARRLAAARSGPAGPVPEGGRNNWLFSRARSLRARNVPDAEAWQALQDANESCAPPLGEAELRGIFDRAWKVPPGFSLSDAGNAERLLARHGEDLRFVHEREQFLIWRGSHWAPDRDDEVQRRVIETMKGIYDEARDEPDDDRRKRLSQWALSSLNLSRIRAARELCQSYVAVTPEALDADAMHLGVANGVLDLATGAVRPACREDYITKVIPTHYDPNAPAPLWRAFLGRVMAGDEDMVRFLQRAVGYSLTGRTDEQCLFVLYGLGANGKSVFLNTLRALLGEYGAVTDSQTWMVRDRQGPSNDIAALTGRRLVVASETEDGSRFAEVLVKLATGGDPLKVRFLYGEHFEMQPRFKLWLAANHKPVIRGDDWAIWRRIRLLPFTVTIPPEEQDRTLEERLRQELPGILAWAVEGCRAWQREGLGVPTAVRVATDDYRREMDHFGQFLEECCEMRPGLTVRASEVYGEYRLWADRQGLEYPMSLPRMWRKLDERGVVRVKTMRGALYRGIGLRPSLGRGGLEDGVGHAERTQRGGPGHGPY